METQRKQHIEKAFKQSLLVLSIVFRIPENELTVSVFFEDKHKLKIYLCRKDRIVRELDAVELLSPQMIAIGLDVDGLKNVLKAVHHAFMGELKLENKERLSLLLYESKKVDSACIGILLDEQPNKVLKVSDIFEALNLGNEQLN